MSVGVGIAAGFVLTLLLRKVLADLLAVNANETLALMIATVVLAVVALVATAIPARRAASIDPMEALRYE